MAANWKYKKNKLSALLYLTNSVMQVILCSLMLSLIITPVTVAKSKNCDDIKCVHGHAACETEGSVCVCEYGWTGALCDSCGGRVILTETEGTIIDGLGNYTFDNKCTWLIEGEKDASIRLRFEHFETECSWDHLYIYDGNSVFSPLVAVFSGVLIPKEKSMEWMPEVTTYSGFAYLHFYSDVAYNMTGFRIHYKMATCPLECSADQGVCNMNDAGTNGECACGDGFKGDGCEKETCPENCTESEGNKCQDLQCKCVDGFNGEDCSIPDTKGHWEELYTSVKPQTVPPTSGSDLQGRASHKTIIYDDYLYVVGGYTFGAEAKEKIYRLSIESENKEWEEIVPARGPVPAARYGHSLVEYEDKLYIYGGLYGNTVTNELWQFDLEEREWTLLDPEAINEITKTEQNRLAVVGHSAHVVRGIMYIIFGHSPIYGYMNTVQQCNISTMKSFLPWTIVETTGAIVKGGYGHSSVYDSKRGLIYVHAGYHSGSRSSYHLTDVLYAYNISGTHWKILQSSGHHRYLHSAVIMNDLMLVFGGNTHNDTSSHQGAKCFSCDFLAYDIECDEWQGLDPPDLQHDVSRFGHAAEVYTNTKSDTVMYMVGGFHGLMMFDTYNYHHARCESFKSQGECVKCREGIKCAWADNTRCLSLAVANQNRNHKTIEVVKPSKCEPGNLSDKTLEDICIKYKSCPSCVENSYNCIWCGNKCTYSEEDECKSTFVSDLNKCGTLNQTQYNTACSTLHNCHACMRDSNCGWNAREKKCEYHISENNSTANKFATSCDTPCHDLDTCDNCTLNQCMWCSSERRCVESNSYIVSFPYGQCMEWMTMNEKCPLSECEGFQTCEECQSNPACGWCDDGSNTGLGKCIEGGDDWPYTEDLDAIQEGGGRGVWIPDPEACPTPRWYFAECPLCQCNGHSTCKEGSDECIACEDLTTGTQCQYCVEGHYGSPTNGGNCTECFCNEGADHCDRHTGKCFCRTKGVKGDQCDRCDEDNKYRGDPTDGGTCYYELAMSYVFTFNLSQDEKHYTHINFFSYPTDPEKDVEFTVGCSDKALINVTWKSAPDPNETTFVEMLECTKQSYRFSHKTFNFGPDYNTTFYIYVYNFTTPFWVQISFTQLLHIDLVQFFVTFFSCFLALLLLAGLFWKLKQKYDYCRRRQMMAVEMEQRASRPFAMCAIEVPSYESFTLTMQDKQQTDSRSTQQRKKKPSKPSPISLEPLAVQKAAVLSLIVRLPMGDEDYTPPGQTGLTIGSALVSLGNSRKASMEHLKGDKLDRHRKSNLPQSPQNCI